MFALIDHTFSNCSEVGLKIGFKFMTPLWQISNRLYSDVYHCEHCISRASVLIDENNCILSLRENK
jgi:hypothetical protein